jgi:hypothetical protein
LKVGQIAHLDRDRSNSAEENLAFLCFEHHDEYDSRTSQRKGLTAGEVKAFRDELQTATGQAFSMPVHFGAITLPSGDPYAGQYIRVGGEKVASAEISLTPLRDNLEGNPQYAVSGAALFGINREFGPNLGDLTFIGVLINGVIEHSEAQAAGNNPYRIRLSFSDGQLTVEEDNALGRYGMGVTFRGDYRRTT